MRKRGNLALVDFSQLNNNEDNPIKRMVDGKPIEEVPMPEGVTRRITPEIAQALKERVNKAASEAAAEFGVLVSIVLNSLDETDEQIEQDITIKFSAQCPVGQDRFAKTLLRSGNKNKIPPSLYGHSFIKGRTEYIITGLDDSDRRDLMVRMRNPKGNVMARAKQVMQFLKQSNQLPDSN